jgi:hypothetical protein
MPDLAAQLTRCQDNEILDHLRWHIAQRRMPSTIEADPAHSVVVVRFTDGQHWRHEITPGWFVDYWEDARTVVATVPELPQMGELPPAAYALFSEERSKCADDIRRWKESHHENG